MRNKKMSACPPQVPTKLKYHHGEVKRFVPERNHPGASKSPGWKIWKIAGQLCCVVENCRCDPPVTEGRALTSHKA